MKNIVIAGVVIMTPFMNLIADGQPEPIPKMLITDYGNPHATPTSSLTPKLPTHEHRVNFGLLSIGYERIKRDAVYTGFDTKVASILYTENDKSKTLDHYVNGELRLGYNHTLGSFDTIMGYGGVGFSIFSVEKQEGKLRNWNYGTVGLKYLHQFGEIFEMGLHLKGCMSISQKRYEAKKVEKPVLVAEDPVELKREDPNTGAIPRLVPIFSTRYEKKRGHLTAVKVNDSRFITQIGLPLVWHIGSQKNWEIQFEPYYMQIPNVDITHIIGSHVTIGYRY